MPDGFRCPDCGGKVRLQWITIHDDDTCSWRGWCLPRKGDQCGYVGKDREVVNV